MNRSLVAGLLELWPDLPLRGGQAWLAISAQAAALLADYGRAGDDDKRTLIAIKLIKLFEKAGLGELLANSFSLGVKDRGTTAGATPPEPGEEELRAALERRLEAESGRTISAWVDGLGVDEPLALGRRYELLFGETPRGVAPRASIPGPDDAAFWGEDEQIDVLVILDSDDLTIHGDDHQTLVIARRGEPGRPARFTVEAGAAGQATVRARLIVRNRPFQKLTLTFAVGPSSPQPAGHRVSAGGLTVNAALRQIPDAHRVSLTILRRESAYELLLVSGSVTRAMLRISETQLAGLIESARRELRDIGEFADNGHMVYNAPGAVIPEHIHRRALHVLARLGSRLYQRLFFGPGSGADAHHVGTLLRELSATQRLRIEVVGERFIFPWMLLYDCSAPDPAADEEPALEHFWGFRHTIEYLPELSNPALVSLLPEIRIDEALRISYIYNQTIDKEVPGGNVDAQGAFLRGLPSVIVSEHSTCRDLYKLLSQGEAGDDLLYFYCRAVGAVPGVESSLDASRLVLSDGDAGLEDLYDNAPANGARLLRAPLVFLNACESARLSPYLYDGLVPYLITKGARGVVGTEANIPAHFAAEFAQALLKRFVAGGATLGEALDATRQQFLTERRNVLGLLYALYCNGDVRIQWPPA